MAAAPGAPPGIIRHDGKGRCGIVVEVGVMRVPREQLRGAGEGVWAFAVLDADSRAGTGCEVIGIEARVSTI